MSDDEIRTDDDVKTIYVTVKLTVKGCANPDEIISEAAWGFSHPDIVTTEWAETESGMKMKDYKIEKGIPRYNHWSSLTEKMEVGDSILFPTREKSRGAVRALQSQGFKYKGQTVPGGYRIWKEREEGQA